MELPPWIGTREMAEHLAISVRTLMRMKSRSLFREGKEFRRMNPTRTRSVLLWHVERASKRVGFE
jgi:hypothetical protein